MKSAWLPFAIAVGAAAALLVIVLLVFSGKINQSPEEAAKAERSARSERVQQRLQELSEARTRKNDGATTGASGGKIDVHSQVAPTPNRAMGRPRPGAEAAKSRAAAADGESADQQETEPPRRLPDDIDPEDVPALSRMALQDADPDRREAAVTLLGASEDAQVIPILAQALADQDEDVRMAAVQSLSDFTGEAPFEAVGNALNDPSADIRYEALETLSDLDEEKARPFLQRALSDPDEEVQALAEGLLDLEAAGATPEPQGQPTPPGSKPVR